jgi:hypothetical protein
VNTAIRAEWSLTGDGDRYGDTMEWCFACAYALWAFSSDIPAAWQFRAGAGLTVEDIRDDYPASILLDMLDDGTVTADDIRHAGDVFVRYADVLTAAGQSY